LTLHSQKRFEALQSPLSAKLRAAKGQNQFVVGNLTKDTYIQSSDNVQCPMTEIYFFTNGLDLRIEDGKLEHKMNVGNYSGRKVAKHTKR